MEFHRVYSPTAGYQEVIRYETNGSHSNGAIGPLFVVLAIIIILGVLAGLVGRVCGGRHWSGDTEYDFEGWVERRCANCIDGDLETGRGGGGGDGGDDGGGADAKPVANGTVAEPAAPAEPETKPEVAEAAEGGGGGGAEEKKPADSGGEPPKPNEGGGEGGGEASTAPAPEETKPPEGGGEGGGGGGS